MLFDACLELVKKRKVKIFGNTDKVRNTNIIHMEYIKNQ